jgi:N-acetylglucosaminyldiphosphoundecaprenol N-acetyl-beta-D-mannosaminyltransferase
MTTPDRIAAERAPAVAWPRKRPVLGVGVSVTTYDEVVEAVAAAADRGVPAVVTAFPVHGVVTSARDPSLRRMVGDFDVVAPDGQPVRWALNLLHRAGLADRVYGPELMLRICRRAAADGTAIYLYGSLPHVVERLRDVLVRRFPALRIAGCESPPFRPLSEEEDRAVVARIRGSGARIVFVGLGCPLQDAFAATHRALLDAVLVCVGAAFDFHAGTKRMAPGWMQRNGLEWLFRLAEEPRRLWRRYLVTNTIFVARLSAELARAWVAAALRRRQSSR